MPILIRPLGLLFTDFPFACEKRSRAFRAPTTNAASAVKLSLYGSHAIVHISAYYAEKLKHTQHIEQDGYLTIQSTYGDILHGIRTWTSFSRCRPLIHVPPAEFPSDIRPSIVIAVWSKRPNPRRRIKSKYAYIRILYTLQPVCFCVTVCLCFSVFNFFYLYMGLAAWFK